MLAVVTHRERKFGAGGDAFLLHCFEAVGNMSNYDSYGRAMQGTSHCRSVRSWSEKSRYTAPSALAKEINFNQLRLLNFAYAIYHIALIPLCDKNHKDANYWLASINN